MVTNGKFKQFQINFTKLQTGKTKRKLKLNKKNKFNLNNYI